MCPADDYENTSLYKVKINIESYAQTYSLEYESLIKCCDIKSIFYQLINTVDEKR